MFFNGQCRRMFWSSLVMLGLNFFCPDNSRLGPIELGASGPLFWSLDLLGKAKISAPAKGKHCIPRILLSFVINIDPSILHLSQSHPIRSTPCQTDFFISRSPTRTKFQHPISRDNGTSQAGKLLRASDPIAFRATFLSIL